MSSKPEGYTPVVSQSWQKRYSSRMAGQALYYLMVNTLVVFLLYFDMNSNSISSFFDLSPAVIWYAELGMLVVVVCKVMQDMFHLIKYFRTVVLQKPVLLSDQQKRLLGVRENEKGFGMSPEQPRLAELGSGSRLHRSQSFGHRSRSGSPELHSSPELRSPSNITYYRAMSPSPSTLPLLPSTLPYSPSTLPYSPSTLPYSPSTLPYSPSASLDRTWYSYSSFGSEASPASPLRSDWGEHTSIRSRLNNSTPRLSPAAAHERITDHTSLTQFIRKEEEKEYRKQQATVEGVSLSGSQSFWSCGASALDVSHVLKKFQYQVATRSSQSPTAKTAATDQSLGAGGEEMWARWGVGEDTLYRWIERLRKWISLTVISRLSQEIDAVNKSLTKIGCEDTLIGEVNVSTLKQLALTKGPLVLGLNAIIPFLDFSADQEYLVRRIKDLGTGCMSEYTWNSGGHYSKAWAEHLPTDASLVMHLLCTYLDSRLPAHPRYPDGKTFTAQYFLKTPDKPDLSKDVELLLYQSSTNQPHFQTILHNQLFSLPKGRNNMFQAILLFFYHVKTKEAGMLGRVNLGLSGLNLLWIFD